jgi:predicted dehydrogenase
MENFSRRSFLQKVGLTTTVATTLISQSSFKNYEGKKLNIALCGLGRYAEYLTDSFKDSKHCHLAGLITGTPSKAKEWGKKYNIPSENIYNYQNFDEIVNNKNIDLVYVVLPNSMHKEYVIRAAKAKKHVIVEKPMALSVKDCQEMIKVCEEMGVQLAMGYRLHYEPYHLELKRLGQEKIFGALRLIEVSLGYKTGNSTPKEWRLVKALSGGGPLMNLGVYCIQAGRYVTGEEPMAVTAQFGKITDQEKYSEVEESITWPMEFPSGAVCTSTSSYNCGVDRFFASADDGYFELQPAVSYGPFRGRTSKGELNFPDINQQAAQMDGIGKVILNNQKLPLHITGKEGMNDMKVIEAIYKAARTGKRVLV